MNTEQPILITGIPRSGASMIAGVINLCGAFSGDVSYHKGAYENGAILRFVEESYLQTYGFDPMGQFPLPDVKLIPNYWKKSIETHLIAEGYSKGPWMYKSSRLSLLWKIWHNAYPNAKWIIVRRKTPDIIQSCIKTGYMKAFKDNQVCQTVGANSEQEGWLWWIHQYEEIFVEMVMAGVNCKQIWPERMVSGDYKQLYETIEWLGLPWKSEILNFIDPLLWSSRNKKGG